MSTLGPKTKAAIRRIVDALPYLKAEGAAAPTALAGDLSAIRSRLVGKPSSGTRDPHFDSAEEWATEELEKSLADDAKPEAKKGPEQLTDGQEPVHKHETHAHKKGDK